MNDGNKIAYVAKIKFLQVSVLVIASLAKKMKSSQVNHARLQQQLIEDCLESLVSVGVAR